MAGETSFISRGEHSAAIDCCSSKSASPVRLVAGGVDLGWLVADPDGTNVPLWNHKELLYSAAIEFQEREGKCSLVFRPGFHIDIYNNYVYSNRNDVITHRVVWLFVA